MARHLGGHYKELLSQNGQSTAMPTEIASKKNI
jgi:hypothetical protein